MFGVLVLFCWAASGRSAPAWVDGTPLLRQRFGDFVDRVPPPSAPPIFQAPPRFEVGSRRNFFAVDFTTNRQYSVSATLRAVGDVCYVYVADDQWNARVTEDEVLSLLEAFERRTPANPRRGIYDIVTEAFGNPPDVDGDPRIVLLLLDIRDGYRPGSAFIAGYFTDINELKGVVRDRRWGIQFQSNETEMVYLDTNPGLFNIAFTSSILAHEFQHLVHFGLDPREEIWVNEGCSELAMFLCGYPPTEHVRSFELEPTVSLTDWSSSGVASALPYYGSVYLWMLYLYEHYGGLTTIRSLAQNRAVGIESVDATLRGLGVASGFREVFVNWRTALIADDTHFGDGRYGFQHAEVALSRTQHRNYPIETTTRSLNVWSGEALSFESGVAKPLQVNVGGIGSNREGISVRALLFTGERLLETRDLAQNATTGRYADTFVGLGDRYDQVVLSVIYAPESNSGEVLYEYTARLGVPGAFLIKAFRNPVQREYVEVIALPDTPIAAGDVLLRLSRANEKLELTMRPINGGAIFATTFRVSDASGEWSWELRHDEQVVGEGIFTLSP